VVIACDTLKHLLFPWFTPQALSCFVELAKLVHIYFILEISLYPNSFNFTKSLSKAQVFLLSLLAPNIHSHTLPSPILETFPNTI